MPKSKGIVTEGGEMEVLVDRMGGTTAASPLDRLTGYTGMQYRKGQAFFLLLLFACALVLVFRYEEIGEWFSAHEEDVELKPEDGSDRDDERSRWGLPDFGLPSAVTDWFKGGSDGGNGVGPSDEARRSLPELLDSLSSARSRIDEMIWADYGEYSSVFGRNDTMGGEAIRWPTDLSLNRLKRRMKMKVIESQLRGGGEDDEEEVKFTWVTGGHSAAAAHGNLLDQSYDVTMQRAAEIAFDAVGITYKVKHYGMGSASSPELSLCQDEIYGKHIDVLNWDFGMTDAGKAHVYHFWIDQAGLHPTFPILFAYDNGRLQFHKKCEERGQAGFDFGLSLPRGKLPDTEKHPNPGSLPRGVAYYMCGGHAEQTGICKDLKFDTKWCQPRGKVSWHPGWKDHLFVGRFLASFMAENLVDAVKEMRDRDLLTMSTSDVNGTPSPTRPPSLSHEYLNQLRADEEADRQLFLSSSVPNDAVDIRCDACDGVKIGKEHWKAILRSNPICHSLRLPNQARFDGIMDQVVASDTGPGGYHTGIDEHYKWDTLPRPGPPSSNDTLKSAIAGLRPPWMMATDQEMRKPMKYYGYENGCNLTTHHDFRDGFVMRHEDGWMGNVYPSDAEVEAFSRGRYERLGYIFMCDAQCMFDNCKPLGQRWNLPHVGLPEQNGNITIIVDGQPVTGVRHIFSDCYVLLGKGGSISWGPGTKNGRKGQYEIKFKVPKPGKIVISSLAVA